MRLSRFLTAVIFFVPLGNPCLGQGFTIDGDAPLPFDAVPVEAASPFGGISFSPTFVVMDGPEPSARVNIFNTGDQPIRIRIDPLDLAVDAQRNYSSLEDGQMPAWSALPYLRYAPRQTTLQPGERQVLRLIGRAPSDGPPNEYRSHLRLTIDLANAPPEAELSEATRDDLTIISATADLRYRITLPVIMRTGPAEGTSRISAVQVDTDNPSRLEVTLERDGAHGLFGLIQALDAQGNTLAELSDISVLVPNQQRIVTLNIPESAASVARIVFREQLSLNRAGPIISSHNIE